MTATHPSPERVALFSLGGKPIVVTGAMRNPAARLLLHVLLSSGASREQIAAAFQAAGG
jgi:L-asparaginase/Glu-tRNA(Gln) amidotransferase subunit D